MMQILADLEIHKLTIKAEERVVFERQGKSLLGKFLIGEDPKGLALLVLGKSYYLDGDVERLTSSIAKNLRAMSRYNNQN